MNLLRQIDPDVKPKWDEIINGKKMDNLYEDCPPSLLKGWTDDNLSLWEIDHPEKPDLSTILIALGRSKKGVWEKITFLLFNKSAVDMANINIIPTNGNTGINSIDISKTHYELKNITGKGLCTLIYYIMKSPFEIGNFKKAEYDRILLESYFGTQIVASQKTDNMSIQPSSQLAMTNTEFKSIITNDETDKILKPLSSGSIDPSTNESPSTTS